MKYHLALSGSSINDGYAVSGDQPCHVPLRSQLGSGVLWSLQGSSKAAGLARGLCTAPVTGLGPIGPLKKNSVFGNKKNYLIKK